MAPAFEVPLFNIYVVHACPFFKKTLFREGNTWPLRIANGYGGGRTFLIIYTVNPMDPMRWLTRNCQLQDEVSYSQVSRVHTLNNVTTINEHLRDLPWVTGCRHKSPETKNALVNLLYSEICSINVRSEHAVQKHITIMCPCALLRRQCLLSPRKK